MVWHDCGIKLLVCRIKMLLDARGFPLGSLNRLDMSVPNAEHRNIEFDSLYSSFHGRYEIAAR